MSAPRWRNRWREAQGIRLLEELNALDIGQVAESQAEHVRLRESELVLERVEVRAIGCRQSESSELGVAHNPIGINLCCPSQALRAQAPDIAFDTRSSGPSRHRQTGRNT